MMPEMPARGERYRASCMEGMSGRDRILCRLCLSPLPRSCFRFLAFFLFWRVPEDSFKRAAQKSAFQKRIHVRICPIEDSLSKNHLLSHPLPFKIPAYGIRNGFHESRLQAMRNSFYPSGNYWAGAAAAACALRVDLTRTTEAVISS